MDTPDTNGVSPGDNLASESSSGDELTNDPTQRELVDWIIALVTEHERGDVIPWHVVEKDLHVKRTDSDFTFAFITAHRALLKAHGLDVSAINEGLLICNASQQLAKNEKRVRRAIAITNMAIESTSRTPVSQLDDHEKRRAETTAARLIFMSNANRAAARRKFLTTSDGQRSLLEAKQKNVLPTGEDSEAEDRTDTDRN